MVSINVILENNKEKSGLINKHGLSIHIDFMKHQILLDVGPNDTFIHNAKEMGIDLSRVDTVILSHNHIDHVGGLDSFVKINNVAKIYLMDKVISHYYTKFLGVLKVPIGLKCKDETRARITELHDDIEISKGIHFIKNRSHKYFKSDMNKSLLKKNGNQKVEDDFDHEGVLVLEDDNELVVFCSCSHNGVANIIETVNGKFPGKIIRSFVGGMHLYNPVSRRAESEERINQFTSELLAYDGINYYTGHCTGSKPFAQLKIKFNDRMNSIKTGSRLEV